MEATDEGLGAGTSAPAQIDSSSSNAITEAEADPKTPGESTED